MQSSADRNIDSNPPIHKKDFAAILHEENRSESQTETPVSTAFAVHSPGNPCKHVNSSDKGFCSQCKRRILPALRL